MTIPTKSEIEKAEEIVNVFSEYKDYREGVAGYYHYIKEVNAVAQALADQRAEFKKKLDGIRKALVKAINNYAWRRPSDVLKAFDKARNEDK
jgi:hypothetical protein